MIMPANHSAVSSKLPNTCRNNRKCVPLYFTSKATAKDS
jgi:hypothetical protein